MGGLYNTSPRSGIVVSEDLEKRQKPAQGESSPCGYRQGESSLLNKQRMRRRRRGPKKSRLAPPKRGWWGQLETSK